MYFNELKVWMLNENAVSAEIVCWKVAEESEKSYTPMPIDEILYAVLGSIKADIPEGETDEVIQIKNGYHIIKVEEQTLAVPSITVLMQSGRKYAMNCTAVLE